jgi:hypothetical protein
MERNQELVKTLDAEFKSEMWRRLLTAVVAATMGLAVGAVAGAWLVK